MALKDLYLAPHVSEILAQELGPDYEVTNWTRQFGSLFKAIRMEKTMMFLILMLIIAVATFNLVSSLVMVVTDKESDIAILRTLGAEPRFIMRVFMVQGMIIGCVGTLLGTVGGVVLATHVTAWVDAIERLFHVKFLASNVYYVNYLPSRLHWMDVLHIALAALGMSLIATLYPARRAARIQPAEALRYE